MKAESFTLRCQLATSWVDEGERERRKRREEGETFREKVWGWRDQDRSASAGQRSISHSSWAASICLFTLFGIDFLSVFLNLSFSSSQALHHLTCLSHGSASSPEQGLMLRPRDRSLRASGSPSSSTCCRRSASPPFTWCWEEPSLHPPSPFHPPSLSLSPSLSSHTCVLSPGCSYSSPRLLLSLPMSPLCLLFISTSPKLVFPSWCAYDRVLSTQAVGVALRFPLPQWVGSLITLHTFNGAKFCRRMEAWKQFFWESHLGGDIRSPCPIICLVSDSLFPHHKTPPALNSPTIPLSIWHISGRQSAEKLSNAAHFAAGSHIMGTRTHAQPKEE